MDYTQQNVIQEHDLPPAWQGMKISFVNLGLSLTCGETLFSYSYSLRGRRECLCSSTWWLLNFRLGEESSFSECCRMLGGQRQRAMILESGLQKSVSLLQGLGLNFQIHFLNKLWASPSHSSNRRLLSCHWIQSPVPQVLQEAKYLMGYLLWDTVKW